jgi:hypothetical protein
MKGRLSREMQLRRVWSVSRQPFAWHRVSCASSG